MNELPQVADYLTYCITTKTPVCFLKYGDGEYQCARRFRGHNCDADPYTAALSNGILNSFKYLAEKQNVLIGAWHNDDICKFWQSLVSRRIQWVNYHTIIIDVKDFEVSRSSKRSEEHSETEISQSEITENCTELDKKIELFKTIQETQLPKIIVCNELLQRAAVFLNTDLMINVPLRNWFDTKFGEILKQIISAIEKFSGPCIVMFSAGMSSKVLIGELHKIFPQNIYLDFGSALDLLCTRRDSRGRGYSYETLCEKLASILPASEIWNDPKYDYIYGAAQKQLGIHL